MRRLVVRNSYGLEVWKDIQGYDGLYKVSTLGNVKSMDYNHTGEPSVLKAGVDNDGYLQVGLCKDGKRKFFRVHRLVANAWLSSRTSEKTEVNHIDENKQNNRVENLEYTTHRENMNWGTRTERVAKANLNHPKRSKHVLQFNKQGNLIAEFPSVSEVERVTGIFQGDISKCCNGKRKSAGGYKWLFKD